jgi:hypothetical protein
MPQNLTTWDRWRYFRSEVALRIIAVKNPSSSAGFVPENLGSSGKYTDH